MLGFQAFAKGIMRMATHCSVSKYSVSKPLSLNWSLKSLFLNIDKPLICLPDVYPSQAQDWQF
jgi:hypothetical protein